MEEKIVVNSELRQSKIFKEEYLALTSDSSKWPTMVPAESNEEAKSYCDDILGKGNWKLEGDTV